MMEHGAPVQTDNHRKRCNISPKFWQVFVGSTWGFLTNVERAIIMPSLWLYLENTWNLKAAKDFYAATVAGFCLSILLFTPVVGCAAHYGIRTQAILLISNLFEVAGNIMYMVGQSPWVLLVGRLVSGLGACCDPSLYSDMSKLTRIEERTKYVVGMLLPRQVGLLFGPAFTILTHKLDVKVGSFIFNVYNLPGLIMAILWIVHCIILVIVYPDMECLTNETSSPSHSLTLSQRIRRFFFLKRKPKKIDENIPYLSDQETHDYSENDTDVTSKKDLVKATSINRTNKFCLLFSCTLISLYVAAFTNYFSLLCLESVLPPVVVKLFNWSELEVSWIYLGAGILVIFNFLLIGYLTKCVSDRSMLTFGYVCLLISYVITSLYLSARTLPTIAIGISFLLFGVIMHVIGIVLTTVSTESLFTKLAPPDDMERAQTVFRTVINLGFFAGPFVGGSLIEASYGAFLLMALQVAVGLVMLLSLYRDYAIPRSGLKQ